MALSWSRVTKLSSSQQRRRGFPVVDQLFLQQQRQQRQGIHSSGKVSLLSSITRNHTYRQNQQWNRNYYYAATATTTTTLRGTSVMAPTSDGFLSQSITSTTSKRPCNSGGTIRREFNTAASATKHLFMPKRSTTIRGVGVGAGSNSTTTMASYPNYYHHHHNFGDILIRAISTRYNEDWTKWLIPRKGTGTF